MHELAAGKIVIRKSQFYAHLYTLEKPEEIQEILNHHHSTYTKAHHHCYAIRLKDEKGMNIEEYSDDGEVGRPGKILLQVLQIHDFQTHALVISRVFGGIKLGVGGVSRAFRKTAEGIIQHYKQQ